jgi:hypothetical protein
VSVATTVEIRGIDKTKAAFASVNKSMRTMQRSVGSLQAAVVGVIGSAALGGLVKTLADVSDRLGKTSARLGISAEDLQKLGFAAEQSGIEVGTLEMALQRFTRRAADSAKDGTGPAQQAFDALGISITRADGSLKDNISLLKEVADGFKGTESQAEKVRLAFKLFDSEGVKLVNLLQQGSGALDAFGNQLESVNGVITDRSISASEQLNDRFNILKRSAQGLLTPLIELVNSGLNPFFESTEKLAMPLRKQRELIRSQIAELRAEQSAVEDVSFSFTILGKEITFVTQKRDDEVAKIQKQIDELKKVRSELTKQIIAQDRQAESAKKAREETEKRVDEENDLAIAFENQISIYTRQLGLFQQGMAMQDESAAKLREHIEERKRLETEAAENEKRLRAESMLALIQELKDREEAKRREAEAEKALTAEVAKSTISTIAGMSATLASESRELFNLNKAASIAMVYINAAEAASKAYAQLGVFGPIAAGTIYALAIANIGKIASQNYPERQAGGDVRPGETYLVGERGPELLTMGQYGGNITPNRNLGQGVMINIYDGTGRKIDQAMSDLRVEVVERAQQFGEFAALESRQYTQNAFA